jgi:NAD(P)-dependent dehydrogenase (short-subunit alcohol dehydrogenase family)
VLEGKTCFITGGARGIGLGIARACAARGARLALVDLDKAALEAARASLEGIAEVQAYELDVTDRTAFLALADQVESDLGPVTAVFNNAGIIDSVAPAAMRGEVWDWMVDVNLHGVYNGVQAFVPRMIARGEGGYVVNTSSVSGLLAAGSGFAYHATKFAVVGLSESLRLELARHRISVSVACPGQVATDIVQNVRNVRPANAEAHSSKVQALLDTAHQALQDKGVSIDSAGESIVAGALEGKPYLFTDGNAFYRALIEQRTAAIVECFPLSDEEPLTSLAGTGS